MSSKENNEVAVEKIDNDKSAGDAKCELKGTKRAAEEKNGRSEKGAKGGERRRFGG
jgi:hypothetical protein